MKNPSAVLITVAAAVVVALASVVQQPIRAYQDTQLLVPPEIEVPAGFTAFLQGHAIGTQNYMCLVSGSGVAWTPVGPQATLFADSDRQIITHFLSPNPLELGTVRATWQHSRDTSAVWARPIASSSDPDFVAPAAIPWLLLERVGSSTGPVGGRTLTGTRYIHRVNTSGGIAPDTGCGVSTDIGKRAFVPYVADYIFYRTREEDDGQ